MLFIEHIIRPPIQQHLIDAVLFQIQTERDGYVIDRTSVKGCVDFLGLLRNLKRLGYDGPFLIEMWSELSQDYRREIQQAQKYLYSKLKEAGYDVT